MLWRTCLRLAGRYHQTATLHTTSFQSLIETVRKHSVIIRTIIRICSGIRARRICRIGMRICNRIRARIVRRIRTRYFIVGRLPYSRSQGSPRIPLRCQVRNFEIICEGLGAQRLANIVQSGDHWSTFLSYEGVSWPRLTRDAPGDSRTPGPGPLFREQ